MVLNSDEECTMGPSKKKTRADSLQQDDSVEGLDKWRQHVADALEIVNVERHVFWMQLEEVLEVLDVANIECHSIRVQLKGIHQAIEYFTGIMWKTYVGRLVRGWGEGSSKGVMRHEM